ncbi:MAG: glycosyltransferase [Clostridia bacterium]|nr:glycosyltransferase [Clostridia bacterium]
MNIAVFTDVFFPERGGTEFATYYLCKALINSGHKIMLFCPDYHTEQSFDEFPVFRVRSIKISDCDMISLVTLDKGRIFKAAKEFSPDIVYFCTGSGMAKAALRVAKKLKIPAAATIHTKYKEAFYYSTHSKFIARCATDALARRLNKADKVLTVSHDMARQLKSYGCKNEITVIRNGINKVNLPVEIPVEKPEIAGRHVNFMYCGHLIEAKNIHFTLKSLGYLKRERGFENFTFNIVGKGDYEKKLKEVVKKENLEKNVVFKGFIKDRTELNSIYGATDLFLFPSTFDTDGLVICEAAQMGAPTVTLKNYGASERITDNETGFLADYDLKKFAERIYGIINDPELFAHVCKNVVSLHGEPWIEVAKKYEKVFEKMIERK